MSKLHPINDVAVLVVEDEYLISLMLEDALEAAGFSVTLATGGTEAIKHVDATRNLAALVTDIRLGAGPTGWEVAHQARKMIGGLPVVYTSGDSGNDWQTHGVPSSIYIPKPYTTDDIITAISTLINCCD